MLAQPITSKLASARKVLLAGCGGGYDIMGALPLIHELRARDIPYVLASFSFTYLPAIERAVQDLDVPTAWRLDAGCATELRYCPEAWLADFLDRRYPEGPRHVVHAFEKTGVQPLAAAYRKILAAEGIDAMVVIDGGIDALLRGDEFELGTPAEDLTSLAALASLDVPTKVLACVGMGAELRDGIAHVDAFERIAALTARGAFWGAAALLPSTAAGDLYLDAIAHVFEHQRDLKTSHVHTVVRAACRGEFGHRGPDIWLSPLLNMMWFFDAQVVIDDHVFLRSLADTHDIWDVVRRITAIRKDLEIRGNGSIPL
jgi:hypothetical protein